METRRGHPSITPGAARAALEAADAEEAATRNRPVPGWYFPVLASLVLLLFASNAVDADGALRVLVGVTVIVVALGVAILVARISFTQPGYRNVRVPLRWTIVSAIVGGAFAVAPVFFADHVGAWLWVACGMALAVLIAGLGSAYWRRTSRG